MNVNQGRWFGLTNNCDAAFSTILFEERLLTTVYNCAQIKLTDPRDGCKLWEMLLSIPTGDGHDQEQDSEYDTRIISTREVHSRHCDQPGHRQKYSAQVFAPSRAVCHAPSTTQSSFQA